MRVIGSTGEKIANHMQKLDEEKSLRVDLSKLERGQDMTVCCVCVHSFSFGTPFPGMINPLDGVEKSFLEGMMMSNR